MITLWMRKYWYGIILFFLILAGIFSMRKSTRVADIIKEILERRRKVEKEIEIKREIRDKKIREIDAEYEKKKRDIEKRVEKVFEDAKSRGLLDEIALKLFANK